MKPKKTVLITGGAGFIGINAAEYYIKKNFFVILLDNFSRVGVEKNVAWLKKNYKGKFEILRHDIRYAGKVLDKAVSRSSLVIHLAGQVAVTTSIENPRNDFESNALGTFNVLEAVRQSKNKPIFIYSSTNKVYGDLNEQKIKELRTKYVFVQRKNGIDETVGINFHSPYGCSKGAAEQYVHDYSKIYNLKTIVFRQSCIYGQHQLGVEDQGWVAWFLIAAAMKRKITIYGNGKQVRDLLHIDDLLQAYDLAVKNIKTTSGQIYNIGGGFTNAISIWEEFGPILEKLSGRIIKPTRKKERIGDQKIYISDNRKAYRDFGWKPKISLAKGLKSLYEWIENNKELFI